MLSQFLNRYNETKKVMVKLNWLVENKEEIFNHFLEVFNSCEKKTHPAVPANIELLVCDSYGASCLFDKKYNEFRIVPMASAAAYGGKNYIFTTSTFWTELTAEEQTTLLFHEMGHHVHKDVFYTGGIGPFLMSGIYVDTNYKGVGRGVMIEIRADKYALDNGYNMAPLIRSLSERFGIEYPGVNARLEALEK